MNKIDVVEIVDEKRGPHKEFLVTLFEHCNLNCSFCLQDHDSVEGIDKIREKVGAINTKVVNPFFHQINVAGGELFHDGISDHVFEDYKALCRGIHDTIDHYEISFATNLVFTHVDRLFSLMTELQAEGINVNLCSSYDPRGRFNNESIELFMDNVILFKPFIRSFQVTMTKPSLTYFQKGIIDPLFDFLYENFVLYFDHYTPGPINNPFQCTEREIVDFYIYMLDKYPNIEPLKSWRLADRVESTCRSTVVVHPDNTVSTCRGLLTENPIYDFDAGQAIKEDLETKFVEKYDCFNCEFFDKCALSCFLHNDIVENTDDVCQYKRLHRHMDRMVAND